VVSYESYSTVHFQGLKEQEHEHSHGLIHINGSMDLTLDLAIIAFYHF